MGADSWIIEYLATFLAPPTKSNPSTPPPSCCKQKRLWILPSISWAEDNIACSWELLYSIML